MKRLWEWNPLLREIYSLALLDHHGYRIMPGRRRENSYTCCLPDRRPAEMPNNIHVSQLSSSSQNENAHLTVHLKPRHISSANPYLNESWIRDTTGSSQTFYSQIFRHFEMKYSLLNKSILSIVYSKYKLKTLTEWSISASTAISFKFDLYSLGNCQELTIGSFLIDNELIV